MNKTYRKPDILVLSEEYLQTAVLCASRNGDIEDYGEETNFDIF